MRTSLFLSLVFLVACVHMKLDPKLSATPPMGFNSWNHFGLNINEDIIKEIADAFVTLGLDSLGYRYINIDDGWAHVERGSDGHVIVDSEKFPNGIKHVADYVHSKRLKFGIYSDGGVHTCGGQAGSLGYETIDASDYDEWGVDYLKYDNCYNQGIPSIIRYSTMSEALNNTKRDIFYSMCNWGEEQVTEWSFMMGAGSWRISGDIWDDWKGVVRNLQWLNQETKVGGYGPGIGWNDADMLEVGNGGMSTDEYRAHFSLWCLIKSPLLIGNDVRSMTIEDDAYQILSNKEAIAVNQDPLGVQGKCVLNCDSFQDMQVWMAPLEGDAHAIVIVNFGSWKFWGDRICWSSLGLEHDTYHVRDLWDHKNEGIFSGCYGRTFFLDKHASKMIKISKAQVGDCELHPEDDTPFESKPCPTISF